jgi:hypothetical protein
MEYDVNLAKELCKEMGIRWDENSKRATVNGIPIDDNDILNMFNDCPHFKVGDSVWVVLDHVIIQCHITIIEEEVFWVSADEESWGGGFLIEEFGEKVFASLSDAQNKLSK